MHTVYEAQQKQRAMERKIRETKRILAAQDECIKNTDSKSLRKALQEDFDKYSIKLKNREEQLNDFCEKTGLRKDNQRFQKYGFGRSTAQKAVWVNKKTIANSAERGIIKERGMANGLRISPYHILTKSEIESLNKDIEAIKADKKIFKFNSGMRTGYNDDRDLITVRGDVLPDHNSKYPRDLMSQRAVLAHEYYGHRAYRGTTLPKGSWNDEFRASYMAAKNCPNLSDEDRRYLILDALERAKEKGVTINHNNFIRRVLYGY